MFVFLFPYIIPTKIEVEIEIEIQKGEMVNVNAFVSVR